MLATQLNTGVAAFQNIDAVTLHTGDPGNTGENDSGETPQALTWSTPSSGWMKASATFETSGEFTHIGLWDGDTFLAGLPFAVTLPTAQTLIVLVEMSVEVKA